MLTLLIGKITKVCTTCGHPNGYEVREEMIDSGYHSVEEALKDNASILFEEVDYHNDYLIFRSEDKEVYAIGFWSLGGLIVNAPHQQWHVASDTSEVIVGFDFSPD